MTQFYDIKLQKLKFDSENNTSSLWETYEGHIINSKIRDFNGRGGDNYGSQCPLKKCRGLSARLDLLSQHSFTGS